MVVARKIIPRTRDYLLVIYPGPGSVSWTFIFVAGNRNSGRPRELSGRGAFELLLVARGRERDVKLTPDPNILLTDIVACFLRNSAIVIGLLLQSRGLKVSCYWFVFELCGR